MFVAPKIFLVDPRAGHPRAVRAGRGLRKILDDPMAGWAGRGLRKILEKFPKKKFFFKKKFFQKHFFSGFPDPQNMCLAKKNFLVDPMAGWAGRGLEKISENTYMCLGKRTYSRVNVRTQLFYGGKIVFLKGHILIFVQVAGKRKCIHIMWLVNVYVHG